jgi:CheY-like chemotaxis protein
MAANETVRATPAPLETVRAQQMRLLYADGDTPIYVTAAVGVLLVALFVYLKVLSWQVAGLWIGALAVQTFIRVALRDRNIRLNPPEAHWRRWAYGFTAVAALGGLVWGAGALWLLPPGRLDLQLLVIVVLVAIVYAAISGVAAYLPAFYGLFAGAFAPPVAWILAQGDALHVVGALLLLAWAPSVVILARRYNASLVQAVRLRIENASLVRDVIGQKELAHQAAEEKSRFVASAGHDLRQPSHTLGLLVGALRSHRLPGRSAELIERMERVVAAYDDRLAALVDGPQPEVLATWAPEMEAADFGPRSGLVLVVDQDQDARIAMSELLQGWGYRVAAVVSGEEAVASLEKQAGPDLIVCDGQTGGCDAIRTLREEFGRVPAMLVTGEVTAAILREAAASESPVLRKPLAPKRLRAAVASLMRRPVRVGAADPDPAPAEAMGLPSANSDPATN